MVTSVGKNPQLALAVSLLTSQRAMNSDAMAVMTLMKSIVVPNAASGDAVGTKVDVKA